MRIHRIAVSFLLLFVCSMTGIAVAQESFKPPKSVKEANDEYGIRRNKAMQAILTQIWENGGKKGDWGAVLVNDKGYLATGSIMIALAALRDQDPRRNVPPAEKKYAHLPPADFPEKIVKVVKEHFDTNKKLLGTRGGTWIFGFDGDFDMKFVNVISLLLEFDEKYVKPEAGAHIVKELFDIKKDYTQREDMTELILRIEVSPGVKNTETENHTLSINSSKYLLNQYVYDQLRGNTATGKLLKDAGFKDASKYDPAKLTRIRDWILQACARILHNELFETNARPYQGITFRALFNIYAYANDTTLRKAARNALDAIVAKMAFQSYQGTRYTPIRRSHEHIHEYQLLKNDYLLSTIGLLSGARPGINHRGISQVMLQPKEPRYQLPATVHSYFLDHGHGYWARMQAHYTLKHYEYGKDPKYFDNGKAFNQGAFKPAVELYFTTPDFLNTSGGRYNHYQVYMERTMSEFTVYNNVYAYDFLSVPQTVITHPVMKDDEKDEIQNVETLTNHPGGGGILNMLGTELWGKKRMFWKSDNSGTFKNFAYGFRFPTKKSNEIACRPGYVEELGMCYKPCKPGYKGYVTVCWANCPPGTVNDGVTCRTPIETKAKKSYGRTAGKAMGCADNEEKEAGLCYKKCAPGYHGIMTYCYRDCPSEFRNDGLYCGKPKAYGRGVGKVSKKQCEDDHGDGKCEKYLGLWYQKCKEGFHNSGCCICSPDCPSGMKDIGVSCEKQKSHRGVGKPLHTCAADQEKDGLLCYPRCQAGYHGQGPMCWSNCPSGFKDTGAFCTKGGEVQARQSYDRGVGEVPLGHDSFGETTKDAYLKEPWNVPDFITKQCIKKKQIHLGDMVEVSFYELTGAHGFFVVLGWIHDNETKEYSRGFWEIVPRKRFKTLDELVKHVQEVNKNNFPAKGNFKYRLATSGDLVELRRDLAYVKDIGRSCNSPLVSIQDHEGKVLHSANGPSNYYYNQCKDDHGVPFVASLPLMEVFEVDESYRFTGNILAYAKAGKLCVVTPKAGAKGSKLCLDSVNYKNPGRNEGSCTGIACALKPW